MPAINAVLTGASKTRRPNAVSFDYLTAFTPGPLAIGNTSLGPTNRPWRCRVDNAEKKVYVAKANDGNTDWVAETLLFSFTGVECLELDVSFEQAARPVVTMERATGTDGASEIWLYWFKPSVSAFVFESFGTGRTPRVILDYPFDTSISDIILFYISEANGLVYRQQRDLYAVELATPITDSTDLYMEEVAYLNNWRIGTFFSQANEGNGHFSLRHIETTMYPIPLDKDNTGWGVRLASGTLLSVVIFYETEVDSTGWGAALESGSLITPLIDYIADIDNTDWGLSLLSGTLGAPIILHTLYDIDNNGWGLELESGTLAVVIVIHNLYDVDEMDWGLTLRSGTLA